MLSLLLAGRSAIVALALLLGSPPPGVHVGTGTVFSNPDRWNPDPSLACARRLYGEARELDPAAAVVALPARLAPCGARVTVCRLRAPVRCVEARVEDRGPRRALIDMTPAVARAIGHNGREAVVVWVEEGR